MAKNLVYPTLAQAPKVLLKFAMNDALQTTSKLLLTSVLGCWIVALVSYVIQMHFEIFWAKSMVNVISLALILFFALTGVIQCNALYLQKKMSDMKAMKTMLSKAWITILMLGIYVAVLLLITWMSGYALELLFKPGSMTLGIVRIALGFSCLFFLVATFLIFPLQVMTDKSPIQLLSELMHVCTPHWLRCFLCLFAWLIVINLLVGNLALFMVPMLMKIAYSMLILKTLVAVLALPVLISYTTLLAHDIHLRATTHSE